MSDSVVDPASGAASSTDLNSTFVTSAKHVIDIRPADEVVAEPSEDPEVRAELEAREAVRRYGVVRVLIRNVIVQGPVMGSKAAWIKHGGSGFRQEFDDLDTARSFADEHKWFFNNCRVEVEYLVRYHTRIEQVPAYQGSWMAPMIDRDVTYAVWRAVPGFSSGKQQDRLIRHHVRRTGRRTTRYVVLGGPGGRMAMVPAASPTLTERYEDWFRLVTLRVHGTVDYSRLNRIYDAVRRGREIA